MQYIYGINPSFEILSASSREVREAFIFKTKSPRMAKLESLLVKKDVKINYVDKGVLINLSGTKKHQGVVLHVSNYPYVNYDSIMNTEKLLLLDNIEDPHNLGAIIRSAEVFGFHSILLAKRGTPEIYSSVVKVSAGATEHLKICKELNANSYVKKALDKGYTVIALDENGKSTPEDIKKAKPEKILLVIGGEDKSVGQFIINSAQYVLSFKQYGKVNSLNASVAAGVGMYMISSL
ncbi:MAG TPA: RNA methyltransferase [Victivallales bacterium]|nr:RNA methyltransferase [Victivallales bacterium]